MDRISPTVSFERVKTDLSRISREMVDLQRQLGSGRKAETLGALGAEVNLALSARGILKDTEVRLQTAKALEARFTIQDVALDRSRNAISGLREEVLRALASGDARTLGASLNFAFEEFRAGLNTTWAGQFLFSGEEIDRSPVTDITIEDLAAGAEMFRQPPVRVQRMDVDGATFDVAPHAATIGQEAAALFADLQNALGAGGANVTIPLSPALEQNLRTIAGELETAHTNFTLVQSRNGERARDIENSIVRLEGRMVVLEKSLSDRIDADPTEVAVDLSQRQSQYEALARVFSSLRDLTLLNYLR